MNEHFHSTYRVIELIFNELWPACSVVPSAEWPGAASSSHGPPLLGYKKRTTRLGMFVGKALNGGGESDKK